MKSRWLPSSVALLLLLLLLEISSVSLQESSKPSFVLLMIDDLGIGDLGCYGIAGNGRPGVFIFNGASGGLPSQEVTFAKIAKQQGYETALIGKWHLGLNCKNSNDHCHHPNVHGFNYFFGIPLTNMRDCQAGHGTVFQFAKYLPVRTLGIVLATAALLHCSGIIIIPKGLIVGLLTLLFVVVGLVAGFFLTIQSFNCVLMRDHEILEQPFKSENLTQQMTHEAVDFIERNSKKPFLLFLSFLQVHTALFASAAFRGTSRHGIYGDAVHEVDWSVGQVMQTLDRLKLREKTLVYLTSDQGAHLEEISASGEVHRGWNGIYKGGKSTNWEGGIRVPGILRWPGNIPKGRQIDEPTSNMDLFPTIVQLSGAELPDDRLIDGHGLMDLLQGNVERSSHEFLFHYCNTYLNAVRWHPQNSSSVWKAFYFTPNFHPANETACFHTLVCFCTPDQVTYHDPPLLFDLSRDPSEKTQLTPDTEPNFHSILAVMNEAVETHKRSVKPVESQLSPKNLMWNPWLQPCSSTFSQFCQHQQDK
ncbi:uncharacterized protein V6R79_018973 [Siganus canaliculatus]